MHKLKTALGVVNRAVMYNVHIASPPLPLFPPKVASTTTRSSPCPRDRPMPHWQSCHCTYLCHTTPDITCMNKTSNWR